MVEAFNGMCATLQRAYGDLRQVNTKLGQDLLVLQQAEEGVRNSEQRFRDYAETASDWFWETGPDQVFTYLSERVSAFGLDRDGDWTSADSPLRSPNYAKRQVELTKQCYELLLVWAEATAAEGKTGADKALSLLCNLPGPTRQLLGFRALEELVDVASGASVKVKKVRSIRHQPPAVDECPVGVGCRYPLLKAKSKMTFRLTPGEPCAGAGPPDTALPPSRRIVEPVGQKRPGFVQAPQTCLASAPRDRGEKLCAWLRWKSITLFLVSSAASTPPPSALAAFLGPMSSGHRSSSETS